MITSRRKSGGQGRESHGRYSITDRRWRSVLTAMLAIYGYVCLRSPGDYRWLDSLDLAIHETGHLLFGFGGETIMLLGGSILQLLVPLAFAVALWRAGDRHGATVPLWWMGQNCWNISVYVRDARTQELPLAGGGEHDWAILLANWDWLNRDHALADTVHLLGVVLYLIAILGGWLLLRQGGEPKISAERTIPATSDKLSP